MRHFLTCWLVCNYLYYSSSLFWKLVLCLLVSDEMEIFLLWHIHYNQGEESQQTNQHFSLKIFVSISCSCVALAEFQFLISFNISCLTARLVTSKCHKMLLENSQTFFSSKTTNYSKITLAENDKVINDDTLITETLNSFLQELS